MWVKNYYWLTMKIMGMSKLQWGHLNRRERSTYAILFKFIELLASKFKLTWSWKNTIDIDVVQWNPTGMNLSQVFINLIEKFRIYFFQYNNATCSLLDLLRATPITPITVAHYNFDIPQSIWSMHFFLPTPFLNTRYHMFKTRNAKHKVVTFI